MRKISAYTDGACNPNPGVGGWGWVMYDEKPNTVTITISDYGGLKDTTNNCMELTAMAEFLEFCPKGLCVDIYSDSDYVLGGIVGPKTRTLTRVNSEPQGWIKGWINPRVALIDAKYSERYWRSDVKNPYEWYRIHQAILKHNRSGTIINFCWVKGHSGVEGNEEADRLSNLFEKEYLDS